MSIDRHSLECLDFFRVRDRVAGYAMTALGKGLTRRIRPATKTAAVQRWLDQVRELQRLVEERGLPPFAGVTDVHEIVQRCAPPLKVSAEEVAQVGDTLAGTHAIGGYLAGLPEDYPELRQVAERIGDFRTIADRIRGVIDERGRVRDEASPKLRRIRADIERAAAETHGTVDRLLRDPGIRRLLQFPNCTFDGDRMVLPLKTEYRGRLPGIVHRTSDSGATVYVEPADVVELNNQISNLRSEETEEINRILWELTHEIHINAETILSTLEALAVLDMIVAKLQYAKAFQLRCPDLNEEARLQVRDARHPLLLALFREQAAAAGPDARPREVVPVSYRLGEDFDLLVITGPNTGGKTVTLKTIGLLSLMVQAGLPVPVGEGSSFPVLKNLYIDVGDEQSMQQSLSTFSAHMTRQLDMLRKAGPETLVLIDELGAGTDPDEGGALGRAILEQFLRLKCRCVATTHIGALKSFPLSHERAENGCVEFDQETLHPTYHLRIGEPGLSNAIEIAQRLGMPKKLVSAARRYVSRSARTLREALEDTATVKRAAERARDEAEVARLAADRAQGAAEAARGQFERQQADFHDWVQRVVHLQPGDAVRVRNFDRDGKIVRLRLDQHRAEVDVGAFAVEVPLGDVLPPQAPAPPARKPAEPSDTPSQGRRARKRAARQAAGAGRGGTTQQQRPAQPRPQQRPPQPREPALTPLTDEQAAQLNEGDSVYVKRFHRRGRLVRIQPLKKLATVNVGLLEVEVPFSGLSLDEPREQQRRKRGRKPRQGAAPDASGQQAATSGTTESPEGQSGR